MAEPDLKRLARLLRRRDVRSVKYYFTDFGISSRFTNPEEPRLGLGGACQDLEVPELSEVYPYDPFKVDIFTLGNVYKQELLEKYDNQSFLGPLVRVMTEQDPKQRPSADEAITEFENLVASQAGYNLRWRLKEPGQSTVSRLLAGLGSVRQECLHIALSFFCHLPKRARK